MCPRINLLHLVVAVLGTGYSKEALLLRGGISLEEKFHEIQNSKVLKGLRKGIIWGRAYDQGNT